MFVALVCCLCSLHCSQNSFCSPSVLPLFLRSPSVLPLFSSCSSPVLPLFFPCSPRSPPVLSLPCSPPVLALFSPCSCPVSCPVLALFFLLRHLQARPCWYPLVHQNKDGDNNDSDDCFIGAQPNIDIIKFLS